MQQAGHVETVIPTLEAQEQPDVVDIFLEKTNEGSACPKHQALVDDVDEEIEVEKADPSPPRQLQDEPSQSNKEEIDKYEEEQNASRDKSTLVASSAAATQLNVDHASNSTAPQMEEEER